jgi:hypothetical protein
VGVIGTIVIIVVAAVFLPMAKAQKKDFDIAETEQTHTQLMATLPDGATVELVGVCEHPSAGKQWWRPDGTPIETDGFRDYDYDDAVIPEKDERARLLALKFDDNIIQDAQISWSLKDVRQSRFEPDYADKERMRRRPIQVILAAFPKVIQSTKLRLGVATGPWKSVASGSPGTAAYTLDSIAQGDVIYHRAREENGYMHISATHLLGGDYDCRIVAKGKDGKVYEPRKYSNPGRDMRHCKSEFNVPLEKVKWFYLQARPFQWVTFKNVSLQPRVKTDVQIDVQKSNIRTEEESSEAKTVLLPDVDSSSLMLDLGSGKLLEIPKADTKEKIWLAIEKLGEGDLVYDSSSLILVRGTTTKSLPDTIIKRFKTYEIGQRLPEIFNLRTREGVEWTIEIHSIDKNGCQLRYFPVHPNNHISAIPLTTLEHGFFKQVLELFKQVEKKYPEQAAHCPAGSQLYHVDAQGRVTIWCYQGLGHRSTDCAADEVGWGSSRLVDAMGMYYLPDGTPLQSRWRERGGGMKDIRVKLGRSVGENERIALIHRHSLPEKRDLFSRDGRERNIMLQSWSSLPLAIIVRIDRPLRLSSWALGDAEADIQHLEEYDQLLATSPPREHYSPMLVTLELPKSSATGIPTENHVVLDGKLHLLENERDLLSKKIEDYKQTIKQLGQEYGTVDLKDRQKMMLDHVASLLNKLTTTEAERIKIEAEIQLLEQTREQPIAPEKLLEMRQNYINKDPAVVAYIDDITELEQEIIVAKQTKASTHPEIQRKTDILKVLKERLVELKQKANKAFDEMAKKEAVVAGEKLLTAKLNELEQKKEYEKRLQETLSQEDIEAIGLGRKQLLIEELQSHLELFQKRYDAILNRITEVKLKITDTAQVKPISE